jgi:large subunit ribosomal protein L24
MMRVKKNDTVVVITGKDKGKQGVVLDVVPDKNLVKVKGIAVVTKHVKARRQGQVSTIKKEESFIHLSNVMPVPSAKSAPCRVGYKVLENGKKVRVSSRTQETF